MTRRARAQLYFKVSKSANEVGWLRPTSLGWTSGLDGVCGGLGTERTCDSLPMPMACWGLRVEVMRCIHWCYLARQGLTCCWRVKSPNLVSLPRSAIRTQVQGSLWYKWTEKQLDIQLNFLIRAHMDIVIVGLWTYLVELFMLLSVDPHFRPTPRPSCFRMVRRRRWTVILQKSLKALSSPHLQSYLCPRYRKC